MRYEESYEVKVSKINKFVDQSFAAAPDAASGIVQKYKQNVKDEAVDKLKRMEARRKAKESDMIWRQRRQIAKLLRKMFRSLSVPVGGLATLEAYRRLTFLNALRQMEKLTGRVYLTKAERAELKKLRDEASDAWRNEEKLQRARVDRLRKLIQQRSRRYRRIRANDNNSAQEEWKKRRDVQQDRSTAWQAFLRSMQTLHASPILQPNTTTTTSGTSSGGLSTSMVKAMRNQVVQHVREAFANLDVEATDKTVMQKYADQLAKHAASHIGNMF